MNAPVVRRLILKDWYLNRWMIFGTIPAGLIVMGLTLTGNKTVFLVVIVLLTMIVTGVGAQLAVASILNERKEQTLAFIMSLPVLERICGS